jgi:hypothetical protein
VGGLAVQGEEAADAARTSSIGFATSISHPETELPDS